MSDIYEAFLQELISKKDKKTEEFSRKIIGDANIILGLKTSDIEKFAANIYKTNSEEYVKEFYKRVVSHKSLYHEEILCMASVIFKTFTTKDDFLREFDRFAPLVNNWAINDFMCCRIKPIKKFFAEFYAHLESYVMSSSPWYNRIAIVCMLDWYLTDEYIEDVFLRLSKITSDDYYVEMAKAWLYATAYIKLPDYTEDYLKRTLAISQSTLSKTLQKIRDSRRVPKNKKEELTKYFS